MSDREDEIARPDEVYEIKDAYWEITGVEYVDDSPPLATSLFDDPDRLHRSWAAALKQLQYEASLDLERQQEIIDRAEDLAAALREASRPYPIEAASPDGSVQRSTRLPVRLLGRLVTFARLGGVREPETSH